MEIIIFQGNYNRKQDEFEKYAVSLGYKEDDLKFYFDDNVNFKVRTDKRLIDYIKENGEKSEYYPDKEDLYSNELYNNNNDEIEYNLGFYKVVNVNTNKCWLIKFDEECENEDIVYIEPVNKDINYYGWV